MAPDQTPGVIFILGDWASGSDAAVEIAKKSAEGFGHILICGTDSCTAEMIDPWALASAFDQMRNVVEVNEPLVFEQHYLGEWVEEPPEERTDPVNRTERRKADRGKDFHNKGREWTKKRFF
jgi:hypothetical protein